MLRRVAPRVSAFAAPRLCAFAAQRARGMCDMTEGVTVDMVCRVFSCKARRSQRTASQSDSAGCTRAHPPNHPPTRLPAACWQVKDDPTAHQMDLVFDGLLDRAAEAEGCAGASPRVENTAGVAGRRGPSGGLTEAGRSLGQPRAWCGAERRLRSASWSEAEPASFWT